MTSPKSQSLEAPRIVVSPETRAQHSYKERYKTGATKMHQGHMRKGHQRGSQKYTTRDRPKKGFRKNPKQATQDDSWQNHWGYARWFKMHATKPNAPRYGPPNGFKLMSSWWLWGATLAMKYSFASFWAIIVLIVQMNVQRWLQSNGPNLAPGLPERLLKFGHSTCRNS